MRTVTPGRETVHKGGSDLPKSELRVRRWPFTPTTPTPHPRAGCSVRLLCCSEAGHRDSVRVPNSLNLRVGVAGQSTPNDKQQPLGYCDCPQWRGLSGYGAAWHVAREVPSTQSKDGDEICHKCHSMASQNFSFPKVRLCHLQSEVTSPRSHEKQLAEPLVAHRCQEARPAPYYSFQLGGQNTIPLHGPWN